MDIIRYSDRKNISSFTGQYRFLSNFYPSVVLLDGVSYPSVEHAFQAAKSMDDAERCWIFSQPSPGEARREGQRVHLRPDWEDIKLSVMEDLLRQKFAIPELSSKLLVTEGYELIEENSWGDTFWGICDGWGGNHLGVLLMKIRSELVDKEKALS